jgi:uncharacterized tellurite resistance protein B-like protein
LKEGVVLTKAIRELLAKRPGPAPGPERPFELQMLAAAALMVECARVNGVFDKRERDAICHAVREDFALDPETAEILVGVAEKHEDEMWADWLFTETIKRHFNREEQLEIVARLWEIALVDEDLHPFEERLIARVARELGLSEEAVARSRELGGNRVGGKKEPRG